MSEAEDEIDDPLLQQAGTVATKPAVAATFDDEEAEEEEETFCSLTPNPSFSRMKVPFHILCQRHTQRLKYEAKLALKKNHERQAKNLRFALDGVRLYRMYIAGAEVPKFPDIFSKSERTRIEELVKR